MKIFTFIITFLITIPTLKAQDELDKMLENQKPEKEKVNQAFKSTRIVNTHSVEQLGEGVLDFRILHRFGEISGGAYTLFGLDQAHIRLGLDYGVTKNLMLGLGRSNTNKDYDGFIKYRIVQQSKGKGAFPVTISWVSGTVLRTLRYNDSIIDNNFSYRLNYYHQLLIARKFNDYLTLQITPTLVHRNLVNTLEEKNDLLFLGFGGRYRLTRRVTFNWDYAFNLNPNTQQNLGFYNPLSLGFDIETGGHVFQLHFTNSLGLNEKQFYSETSGNIAKNGIRFGFNISRVFTVKKPKAFSRLKAEG